MFSSRVVPPAFGEAMVFLGLMIPTVIFGVFGWICLRDVNSGPRWLVGFTSSFVALAFGIAAEVLVVQMGK